MTQEERLLALCEPGTTIVTTYKNAKTPFMVSCQAGHNRTIIGSNLVQRGSGAKCKECITPSIKTRFFSEITKLGLTQLSEYINTQTRVGVSGKCGHTWQIEPDSLVSRGVGATCPICRKHGDVVGTYHHNFLSKLLDNRIELLDDYTGTRNTVTLKYTCGHTNSTTPAGLVQHGTGMICRVCFPLTSLPEQELLEYIKSIYTGWVVERDRFLLDGQELDIVLPDEDLAFEYNGGYWHSEVHKDKNYHYDKTNKAAALNLHLVHIMQEDWLHHKDVVKSRILNLLGKSHKLYARKCEIREIAYPKDFLNTNHIQGAGSATSFNYGLFYTGELVAVMTFSKARFTTQQEYELVRFCTKIGTTIVGGASKLFKHFTIRENPNSIVSYSDRKWSSGNLYKTLGFTYSHTSQPNYRYYSGNTSLSRYQCQKHLLAARFPKYYDPKLTESEIMSNAGYHRVYDAGSDVWTYNKFT